MTKEIIFSALPKNRNELETLPQAALAEPFDTAALAVASLCVYPENKETAFDMIAYLKGPAGELSLFDKQFLRDRLGDTPYIPRSYFSGAVPANDYQPSEPYTVRVSDNTYSYDNQGYAKLYLKSGGADSERPVTLRLAKDGKWYLWEYSSLLSGIRQPESSNPWA